MPLAKPALAARAVSSLPSSIVCLLPHPTIRSSHQGLRLEKLYSSAVLSSLPCSNSSLESSSPHHASLPSPSTQASRSPHLRGQLALSGAPRIPLTLKSTRFFSTFSPRLGDPKLNKASISGSNGSPLRKPSSRTLGQRLGSPLFKLFYRSAFLLGVVVGTSTFIFIAFFIYDATTYHTSPVTGMCHVSSVALNPRIGGPKNLPIADHLVDDDDSPEKRATKHKPKLVILGTGWGSVSLLKTLNPGDYHVVVVSPSNHFCFTPMLPSATVGTLSLTSLVEPARRIVNRVHGHFLKGAAIDVDFSNKFVEVEGETMPDGRKERFYLPYDKLVVGVGSVTNSHGVKGLQHCHFLKDIKDAARIRDKIMNNLEVACLPSTSDEERRRLLSFVVCGGGPTGVEFAAELYDLLNEDLIKSFPKLLRNEISVHIVQSRGHILNTYDEALSKFAEQRFVNDSIDVLTNSRVKEVQSDKIIFTQVDESTKEVVTKELPMGFCLWSTGVSQTQFSRKLAAQLGQNQTNKHALETDSHLRLIGAPLGDVYAIGDCSTIQNNVSDHIMTFLRTIAWEKGKNPETIELTYSDWRTVAKRVRQRFPQAGDHLKRLDRLFKQYDRNQSGTLDFGELYELLKQIDSKLTSLPATAQRAHQQGRYLGHKLNRLTQAGPGLRLNELYYGDIDEAMYRSFEYRHLGALAYVGNAAVFDFGKGWGSWGDWKGGLLAVYLWRSVYFAQSVSVRTRVHLMMDWIKRGLFGRDMMNY